MYKIPLDYIKRRIKEKTSLSDKEINDRIKQKLEQLSGLISEDGAAHILANELGIKLFETGELQIKNILSGMRAVDVFGKVIRKYEERTFAKETRTGKVGSLLLADETGSIRVVLWNDQADFMEKINENDILHIKSAWAKENNGRKELHLNEKSQLFLNPEGKEINVSSYSEAMRKQIKDFTEEDQNIEVLGTIVQVYEPRFFEVCPSCNRRLQLRENQFVCMNHGEINEPSYSYLLSLFLDDGTGNIRTVFFRGQTQRLLGMDDEKIKLFKDNVSAFEDIKTELLGKIIKIIGRVNKNQAFDRMEFIAKQVYTDVNPEEEIKKLNEQLANTAEAVEETDKDANKSEDETEESLPFGTEEEKIDF